MRFFTAHPLSLLLAALIMAMVFVSSPKLFARNSDGPWHVASGEYLLESLTEKSTFPYIDPFSFTPHQEAWVNPAWLYNLALGSFTTLGGVVASILFTALLAGGLVYLLSQHFITRGFSPLAFTLGMILHMALMSGGVAVRPQIMTLYGVSLLYILLHHARTKPKMLSFIPPLFLVWSNVHGGLVIGYVILGAFGLEALFSKQWRHFFLLILTGLASILASLINPYGWEIYDLIYRTITGVMLYYIEEWGSPYGTENWHILVVYMLAFALCMWHARPSLALADVTIFAMALVMANQSIRHISLLGILGIPVFIPALQQKLQHLSGWESYAKRWQNWLNTLHAARMARSLFSICIALIFAATAFWPKWEETLISEAEYPVAEYQLLIKNYPHCRTYAAYDYAGSLLYLSKGIVPVFYDSRAENVYSQQILADGIHIATLQSGWQYLLDKYGVEALLMPSDHPIFPWLAKEGSWQKISESPHAQLWVRKEIAENPMLCRKGNGRSKNLKPKT